MPVIKTQKYTVTTGGFSNSISVSITLDVGSGMFSVKLPVDMAGSVPMKFLDRKKTDRFGSGGHVYASALTLAEIEDCITTTLHAHSRPEITAEPVIRYNIESHVSFAVDPDGGIHPNAGFPGAKWQEQEIKAMYGQHHATNPSVGGYSLIIGAEALLKKTIRNGERVRVEYERWHDGVSHLSAKSPAALLNSWCSIDLGRACKTAREMPYTPEAAMWFHNLMLGMAKLSKMVQEATFDAEQLQLTIANGLPMIAGPKREAPQKGTT